MERGRARGEGNSWRRAAGAAGLAVSLLSPAALYADTAVKSAVDAASIAGTNWTSPLNVQGNDGAYADYNNTAQNYLVIKGFGFTLPVGATIDGVQVVVNGQGGSNADRRKFRAGLTKDGTTLAGAEQIGQFLDSVDSDITLGGGADLWGTTLTRAEVNSADFGVMIRDWDAAAFLLRFDHVTVSVVYTPSSQVTATPTSIAPSSLNQDAEAAFLKLSLATDQGDAAWTAVKVTKTGTLADSGVTTVRVYLDTGNGIYGAEDTLISPSVTAFSAGVANIALTAAQTINTTAKVYFVVYDLDPLATRATTIGASIASQADVTIASPDSISSLNFPASSSNATVADVADTVSMTATNLAPGTAAQGAETAMASLSLATSVDDAVWTAIKVTNGGTLADSHHTTVKIYLDANANGVYDPAADTLISPAVNTFSSGVSNITLSAAQTLTVAPKVYFIVYQLASDAAVGAKARAQVAANTDLTLTAPDVVSIANFPVNSNEATITDVPDTVTQTPTDLAPANILQGSDYAVEKLSLATGGDQAVWTAITVAKTGTLPDGDVTAVKIYLDNGDGNYGGGDTLVSPGNTFSGGSAAITLSAAQTITTTAKVYFIVYTLAAAANVGSTIGAQVTGAGAMTITSPDAMSASNFPVNSSNSTVQLKGDDVTVTPADQAPASVSQGAEYSALRLSLVTNANTAQWTALSVTKTGTAADNAVTTVKIYLDANANGAYDPASDTLISPAVTTFSGGAAAITLSAAQTLTTTAKVYFIVYDLEPDKAAGATIGASVSGTSALAVTSPDVVLPANLPANSSNSTINDVPDTVTMTPANVAPASPAQGSDLAYLKLSLAVNEDQAAWTNITVTKTGTLADAQVSNVKVYLDDGNGVYGAGDTLISPLTAFSGGSAAITLSAAQTITPAAKVYFIVYTLATLAAVGDTIGAQVASNASLTVSGADLVSSANFPASSSNGTVVDGPDTVTVSPSNIAPGTIVQNSNFALLKFSMITNQETALWTAVTVAKTGTAADGAVTSVKIYLDNGDGNYTGADTLISPAVTTFSGGSAAITLTAAQTLTTAAKLYFVVYDLSIEAAVGATIGASVAAGALTVSAPDAVSSANLPAGSGNSSITDLADTITAVPTSVAPAYAIQGQDTALLKLSLTTPQDSAQWTALTVTKTGTILRTEISAVKVYLDDGDGVYDAGDTLLASGAYPGTGVVSLTLSPAQTINAAAKAYFVVYALVGNATIGTTAGVSIGASTDLAVTAPDTVSTANFPANSALSTVAAPPAVVTVTPTDLAPASANQGSEYAALKLAMATGGNSATWSAIKVTKTGTLADAGVSTVKVYLDTGNGTYGAEDTLISPAVTAFSAGTANITLTAAQTINTTAKVYFVVYALTATATPGATVGARVAANTDVTLDAPNETAATNFPVQSTNSTVVDVPDTVTATPVNLAPASVAQGSDFALESLSLATGGDEASWTAITVTKTGTLDRAKISTVKIYRDANANGVYDAATDTLVSPAVTTFAVDNTAAVTLSAAQTINATAKLYFIVYTLASDAAVGGTVGASVASNASLTVTAPDLVSAANFPANSTNSSITDVPDTITVTPTNAAPTDVIQGNEYAMEKLSLATNDDQAVWTAVTVTKTGTLPDAGIDTVKVYLDNGNGTWGGEDTLISPAVTAFTGGSAAITLSAAQTINTTAKVYFIVYKINLSAATPNTIGARVAANTDLTVTAPDLAATTNFPINSTSSNVLLRGDNVTMTPAAVAPASIIQDADFALLRFTLATDANSAAWTALNVSKTGTLADAKVSSVKIYLDDGDNAYNAGDTLISPAVTAFSGGAAAITLTAAQTITTTAKTYFVVYDLASDAPVGNTIGASLASNVDMNVTAPDVVLAANFPANSTNSSITDLADTVTVTPTNVAPAAPAQGSDLAYLKLSLATNEDQAAWTNVTVTKTGTLADGGVTTVKVYLDDGDGVYDAGDTLISPAVTAFSGGSAAIALSAAQTITTTAKVYFIVYTLDVLAAIGDTIGAQVASNASLTVSGADLVSSANFPASSGNGTVADGPDTVTMTPVDMAPASVAQDADYAALRFSLAANQETASWTAVTVTKTGTAADGAVDSVKIYLDANANNAYDPGTDALISPAVTTFSGGSAAITLSAAQTITTTAKVYFVVYDLDPEAAVGNTIGASLGSAAAVTVSAPDNVSSANFPGNSTNSSITDLADTITQTPTDMAPANIGQGQTYSPLKLSLATNMDQAVWTAITVTKLGNLADNQVTTIRIYLDDGNGTYDAGDTLVSPLTSAFSGGAVSITLSAAQTINAAPKVYHIVYILAATAPLGNTIGARALNAAAMTVTAPDLMSASNFPADSALSNVVQPSVVTVSRVNTTPAGIGQGSDYATQKLSVATDQGTASWTGVTASNPGTLTAVNITAVRIYLDDGDGVYGAEDAQLASGAVAAALTLSPSQSITTAAKVYHVVYVLSGSATIGATVGSRVTQANFIVTAPNTVAATNFPLDSTLATVAAREIGVTLDQTLIALGVDVNTEYVIPTSVVATNAGNGHQTYGLRAQPITGGTPWSLGATRALDVFTLQAVAGASQPPSGDFGGEDKLANVAELCTATIFARGTARCDKRGPGGATTLWFKIGMPTLTSTEAVQDIQVTVEANP